MLALRVLIGDVPDDVADWLAWTVSSESGIELIGQMQETFQVLLQVGTMNADVVFVGLPDSGAEPGIVSHLLGEYPHLIVLGVTRKLTDVAVFHLVPTRERVSPEDPGLLWSTVRKMVETRSR
jgi:hypothetical protein